jgi:uncharacterized NAD(P)/FAD-binding protein YdhS
MRNILIIGAGFSGAVTAVQLLRRGLANGLQVLLVNRSGLMARGIAYGTQSSSHLLNVPAGNMSALDDDPDHFVRFCQRIDPHITPASFVQRRLYGDYLEYLLNESERSANRNVSLTRIVGEVTDITVALKGYSQVTLADGQRFEVDQIILAFGHYPPNDPYLADPAFYQSKRYIKDPWAPAVLDTIAPNDAVLLLGTGLTAIDVCNTLIDQSGTRNIYAISRRGLIPQSHRVNRGSVPSFQPTLFSEFSERTVRRQLRTLRGKIEEAYQGGIDWRDVMAAMRPATPQLWQQLPEVEKKRFLRHLQPYWDSHRHRIAPEPLAQFQKALITGIVNKLAGYVISYQEDNESVQVTLRHRGLPDTATIQVRYVINCTGPSSNLQRVNDGFIQQLLSKGLIRADTLGLGLDVSDSGAVINARGQVSDVMYYIGPLLKARYWEATAVPELRSFSQRLAITLLK